jgi:hypothetical protein
MHLLETTTDWGRSLRGSAWSEHKMVVRVARIDSSICDQGAALDRKRHSVSGGGPRNPSVSFSLDKFLLVLHTCHGHAPALVDGDDL